MTTVSTQNNGFGGDFALPQLLRGEVAKWDKENGWHDTDGMALPSTMLVIGTDTLLIRWHPQREEIRDKPLPSASLLNSAIPRSEWRAGLDGNPDNPEPPWKLNYEIRMLDPLSGKLYTYTNSTWGARICWERLNEQVFIQRTLRCAGVIPLVKLDKRPMPTKRGLQSRPHLEPIEFREPGGGPISLTSQPPTPQLPAAAPTAATAEAADAPVKTTPTQAPPTAPAATSLLDTMKPVKPIPIEEFINDSLPPFA
jgi:hypothetical protein